MVPVSIRALSDARNAAALAVSAAVGDTFKSVMFLRNSSPCSRGAPVAALMRSHVSRMVRVSGMATERMHTTLTPRGLRSIARLRMSDSMPPNAVPMGRLAHGRVQGRRSGK